LGAVEWDTRHRLMLKSFLEDGAYARLLYETRFASFCSRMEACLEATIAAGEAVRTPVTRGNGPLFVHHMGAWLALVHLPSKPAIDYKISREQLLHEAVWFALRGMGVTDRAITRYYKPKALSLSLQGI
jgi:hypothetical protein